MPMNGNALGTEIAQAIMSAKATPQAQAACIELWQKISGVIVKHIQDNADVLQGIALTASVDPSTHQGGGSTTATGKIK